MASKEEVFKQRFTAIVADMRRAGSTPEDLLLVGSLAARVIDHAGSATWTGFKARLGRSAYGALLTTFQNQGNALAKQGALRQMHAVEVLACSLIAKTQTQDPAIIADDKLLNDMIDSAIGIYRDSQSADPVVN